MYFRNKKNLIFAINHNLNPTKMVYELQERIAKFKRFRNKYGFTFPNPEHWSYENLQYLDSEELDEHNLALFAGFLKRNGFPIGYFYSLVRYLYPVMVNKYPDWQLRKTTVKIIRDISNLGPIYPTGVKPKRKLIINDDVDDLVQATKGIKLFHRPKTISGIKRRYNDDFYPFPKKYGITYTDPISYTQFERDIHRWYRDPDHYKSAPEVPMFLDTPPTQEMQPGLLKPKAIKPKYEIEPGVFVDVQEYDPTRFMVSSNPEDNELFRRLQVSTETPFSRFIRNVPMQTDAVICCVCEKPIPDKKFYRPNVCWMKNLNRAHVVCENDWWNFFALESSNHACPGCVKGLPLRKDELYEKGTVIEIEDD